MKKYLIMLLIGKDLVKLINDYVDFKKSYSDEGKKISSAEQAHLWNLGLKIAEKLAVNILGIKSEKKK